LIKLSGPLVGQSNRCLPYFNGTDEQNSAAVCCAGVTPEPLHKYDTYKHSAEDCS